ncbi:putative ribonuclease H protein [Vitis vinifera]|uniref:Putative ribonuclease H protein n=1 Tax=Vitis vinifera TaxID=29760 RepID=A0A438FND0_VITVI|nr:putative ribonuclease H protein [Vitis vinifera]
MDPIPLASCAHVLVSNGRINVSYKVFLSFSIPFLMGAIPFNKSCSKHSLRVVVADAEAYTYDDEVLKKAEAMGKPGLVEIYAKEDSFIFTVESTGAIKASQLVLNAIDVLKQKLDAVRLSEDTSYFLVGGFLTPCLVRGRRGEGVQITHLLFADDTLVFCEAKEDQLTHLCWLLMWFEALSGLKVNMEKSELIPVGRVENVGELADEFGYKVGNLPSTYLGMPLGAPFKSSGVWDGIEERFKKRLAMWKRQYISKGGRITLIRSTLSNLPIYFMSIFQIPRAVRIRLEKIQRDFLWGGGALEQKPHLVRWSIVCDDKGKGGLGVKSLGLFNKALLGKWAWRFANEKTALWNQVIRRKYGEEKGGWRSCEIREAYGVGLWKAINKVGQFVTPFFGYEVGDGKNVRFWKDKWCGTSPLSEAFPSLFSIASSKEAWVNEVWTAEGDRRGSWTPTFNRPFNDWELEEVGRLLRCLEGKMVRVDEEDRVRWVESKDGVFSVKSLYRAMQPVSSAWFPSKIIWMSYAQPKISFFAWEASWGRVLTLDHLQKRGWALANRLERFLYGQEEEGDVAFGTVMLVLGHLEG